MYILLCDSFHEKHKNRTIKMIYIVLSLTLHLEVTFIVIKQNSYTITN